MCLRYAELETKLGEIDRARAIYIHGSQMSDPRVSGGASMLLQHKLFPFKLIHPLRVPLFADAADFGKSLHTCDMH